MSSHKNLKAISAIRFSLFTAGALALGKFAVGLLSQSVAIMASALDSAMDLLSSAVNYIAIREAVKPPDKEHTYGHEKIESLAGLFQSLFIGLSGLYLIFESLKRLVSGAEITHIPLAIVVMLISMAASFMVVLQIRGAKKRKKSLVLETENIHYAMDILSNLGVIAALVLVRLTGWVVWDVFVSILVSAYILRHAFKILRRSINELLDRSLPQTMVYEIERIIRGYDESIVGIHNFRSRRAGETIFLDFHIEIRGEDDFKEAHTKTEKIINAIKERYPTADVTVHYDPEGED